MAGIALARLGLSPADFYNLTPIEFYFAIRHCNQAEELQIQQRYEVARYQIYHLWNMQGKRLKRNLKNLKEVGAFPWDKAEITKTQTVEEMKNQLYAIASSFGNKKNRKTNEHRSTHSNHRRGRHPSKDSH